MVFESKFSFINGAIAGAGIVLAIISVRFLQIVEPLEGKMGITATETRLAILIGIIVCISALFYEILRKKNGKLN